MSSLRLRQADDYVLTQRRVTHVEARGHNRKAAGGKDEGEDALEDCLMKPEPGRREVDTATERLKRRRMSS